MVKLYDISRLFRISHPGWPFIWRSVILSIFILTLAGNSILAGVKSVSVAESNEQQLTFRVFLDPSTTALVQTASGEELFYRNYLIAVPDGADVVLNGTEILKSDLFTPVDDKSYYQSQQLVEISAERRLRGYRVVTLVVYPLQGGQFVTDLSISVSFTGGIRYSKGVRNLSSAMDPMLSQVLVNFEAAKYFQTATAGKALAAAGVDGIFDGLTEWYKIEVNQSGMHRVTGSQLEAAGMLTGVSSGSIHLYNGGGKELPGLNEIARPQFREIAIQVEDGGDGSFDSQDYIRFYGESLSRFVVNENSQLTYIKHNYTDNNIYWLTVDNSIAGVRMSSRDVSLNGTVNGSYDKTIDRYTRAVHLEQDNFLRLLNSGKIDEYYTWYWSTEDTVRLFLDMSFYTGVSPVDVTIVGKTLDTSGSSDEIGYFDLFVNGIKGTNKICNLDSCSYESMAFVNNSNSIKIAQMYNSTAKPHFNYLELRAETFLSTTYTNLTIGVDSGAIRFEIDDRSIPSAAFWDISDPMSPVLLTDFEHNSGTFIFYDSLYADQYTTYYTRSGNDLTPTISEVVPVDLYSTGSQADLLVVTPEILRDNLNEYVTYREQTGYSTQVITVEDIMDNFSYGLYDPVAIRDFLKYAYENYPDPKPSAVLLVGDGTYDFLNRLGTDMPNYVPPYIHLLDRSASDDNFIYFGAYGILDSDTSFIQQSDYGYDMVISRWPIRNPEEIAIITDKIIRYESPSSFGDWRTRVVLVADDEFGTYDNEDFHTIQTEALAAEHVPQFLNSEKIYLWEYPFVNRYKPAVNDRIVQSVNDGALMINYVGHGNPDVWAHERVFTRVDDLPRLHNSDKLTMFFAASCAIGFFDDPLREGMAEDLLAMNGGAIGVISATRLVFSSDNAAYNREVFDVLLYNDSLSMCQAVYTAKILRQYVGSIPVQQVNDRNYLYFGDPFVKIGLPQLDIAFSTGVDTLTALEPVTVSGEIIDENTQLYPVDGELSVTILDSEKEKSHRILNSSGQVVKTIDYNVNGSSIFNGTASITGGRFTFTFIPPLDIGFGGNGAKIMLYASLNDIDAAGIIDSLAVSGTVASVVDSVGPEIIVGIQGRNNFASGDYIPAGVTLDIMLTDSIGINIAGGLGHGITLEVDNHQESMVNLSEFFEYTKDSYTTGNILYQLDDIDPGEHTFKIKAWDNANNSTVHTFTARITDAAGYEIVDLLNYPNPMKDSTRFSFSLTQQTEKFTLDIFTLSGRKIQTFTRYALAPDYYDDIVWYGRDADGDRVATEVYIYKATAISNSGGDKVESFGKIIVVN